jgi:hypothetical protein
VCHCHDLSLAGPRFHDGDIASKLDLTEVKVQDCVAWIRHFLTLKTRQELFYSGARNFVYCLHGCKMKISLQKYL